MGDIGAGFCGGVRLIRKDPLDWLVVQEVIAWVQWHLFVFPRDF